MKDRRTVSGWLVAVATACCVMSAGGRAAGPGDDAIPADAAPLFRVFLTDGRVLVSYGEFARVDDRVVFSTPTSTSAVNPRLQLINVPSERVDWTRTLNYAESLRATRYRATRAEADYAELSNRVAQSLNEVGLTASPEGRLRLIERARKSLAEWPSSHYNYKLDEIMQMLGVLDEAIANLRAANGGSAFDLSLVAVGTAPETAEPLLPTPGARETIESALAAADTTDSPAERMSLLTMALGTLDEHRDSLPPEWADATRTETLAVVAREQEIDRKYRSMATRLLPMAASRAAAGDVRGVQRLLTQIRANDAALGSTRPDAVASLVSAVEVQLDVARQLRLERDRWALRSTAFRTYRASMAVPLERLRRLGPSLERIKALAGSSPDAIGLLLRNVQSIKKLMATIEPPSELRDAHNMLESAVQLAENAARIRREAALASNIARAWDASSAAAGSLMLAERGRTELQTTLRRPTFTK